MITNASAYSYLDYICWFSTFYVSVNVICVFWALIEQYVLPYFKQPQDFKQYGQWTVITGSTDGIGKEIAKELASRGVDICLISRSEEKLKNTAQEIEKCYGVKTMYIVADFCDQNIYDHIKENISDLDIGILVNNVGMFVDHIKAFKVYEEKLIKNVINVNTLAATMMTSITLPIMIPKKRGLIINVSSMAGEYEGPYITLYSATKAFLTKFGCCLSYELTKHNIQVKTLIPSFISTNLLRQHESVHKAASMLLPYLGLPTAEQYVQNAFRSLNSKSLRSCGFLPHEFYLNLNKVLPCEIMLKILQIIFSPSGNKKQS